MRVVSGKAAGKQSHYCEDRHPRVVCKSGQAVKEKGHVGCH